METILNRNIEKAVFDYLPDVYLYFALFRCIDIVKTKNTNVSDNNLWNLITNEYDFIASILLKDIFSVELNNYKTLSLYDKHNYLNKNNIFGYHQYGFDVYLDLAKYWDINKIEIRQCGYSLEEFVKACIVFSYNKVRNRIIESKNSKSFVLHNFTSNDSDANLNIYLSLNGFMCEDEILNMYNNDSYKQYINSYIKDYDLEVIDRNAFYIPFTESDFIVGLSSSIKYGINVENLAESFSNPKIISGIFWFYDRKKSSFYNSENPVASMIHTPILNLYKCFQINLTYCNISQ
jgi:hypothetical protein